MSPEKALRLVAEEVERFERDGRSALRIEVHLDRLRQIIALADTPTRTHF